MRRDWFSRRGYAESRWVAECNRASKETDSRMPQEPHLLYALIVVCEVDFWVVLLLALAARRAAPNVEGANRMTGHGKGLE